MKEIEREAEDVRDLLAANDKMLKVLGSGSLPKVTERPTEPVKIQGRQLQNRNITALVRDYIDNFVKEDEAINVPTLTRDYLMAKHDVKGAYRNLYAQVHVILKKETLPNQQYKSARLSYVKGSGFFKRKKDDTE